MLRKLFIKIAREYKRKFIQFPIFERGMKNGSMRRLYKRTLMRDVQTWPPSQHNETYEDYSYLFRNVGILFISRSHKFGISVVSNAECTFI